MKKKYSKTIKLFLLDGEPDGRLVSELSNWTGKAYRLPRGSVKNSSDREDLKETAVYLLFGHSEENRKESVYIGEAENVYSRLTDHLAKKDFWKEALVFLSKDENLNKAHIKYLESRLWEIATESDRFEIKNGNKPTRSSISESDQAEMEEFIDYVKILTNVMGYKVFQPLVTDEQMQNSSAEILYIKAARGANSRAISTTEGCVVLKGSEIANDTAPSCPASITSLRSKLEQDGVITNIDNKLKFTRDYPFSSPSTAAGVVMGRSANGLIEWKTASGIALSKLESKPF